MLIACAGGSSRPSRLGDASLPPRRVAGTITGMVRTKLVRLVFGLLLPKVNDWNLSASLLDSLAILKLELDHFRRH